MIEIPCSPIHFALFSMTKASFCIADFGLRMKIALSFKSLSGH